MKHKMNKISGYYEGPDGVFYDFTNNKIFELEWYGGEVYRRHVGVVGRLYQLNFNLNDSSKSNDKTAIEGMGNVVRLGSL